MLTTKIDAVRQVITTTRPSVCILVGLMKLECVPEGAGIAGSVRRILRGRTFIKIMLEDVNRDYE